MHSLIHTIFSCPNGDLCAVVFLLHCHRDDGDVVGVVRMERSDVSLVGFRVDNLPPPGPCLQFCDIESILTDESMMNVIWRVAQVNLNGGGVKCEVYRAFNQS